MYYGMSGFVEYDELIALISCLVLYFFGYRSQTDTIYTRHLDSTLWEIDARIIPFLQRARLYDFHLVAYGRVDRAMVTTLLERWSQETHNFHLPLGEAIVTL